MVLFFFLSNNGGICDNLEFRAREDVQLRMKSHNLSSKL